MTEKLRQERRGRRLTSIKVSSSRHSLLLELIQGNVQADILHGCIRKICGVRVVLVHGMRQDRISLVFNYGQETVNIPFESPVLGVSPATAFIDEWNGLQTADASDTSLSVEALRRAVGRFSNPPITIASTPRGESWVGRSMPIPEGRGNNSFEDLFNKITRECRHWSDQELQNVRELLIHEGKRRRSESK